MKYCQDTTETHPLSLAHPHFVEDIHAIAMAEGYSRAPVIFENAERALNLDKVKEPIYNALGQDLPRSMDMTIGLKSDDTLHRQMLLVEFKLKVKIPTNVDGKDLIEKVNQSVKMLGETLPIREEYIFIFHSDIKEEARSRFSRRFTKIPRTYIVMDMETFKATYF